MTSQIPIVRLEVEGMKSAILAAFTDQIISMDAMVKDAVERICSDNYLTKLIGEQAKQCIDEAVKDEVRAFFRYTAVGRLAINQAVAEYMKQWTETYAEHEALRNEG